MAIKDELTVRNAFDAQIHQIALYLQGNIDAQTALERLIVLIDNELLAEAMGDQDTPDEKTA